MKPADKTKVMKTISVTELPEQLEGFAGGMGFKSIQHITESELGFDVNVDVKGYISEPVNGVYYAEVIQSNGDADYASGEIDELQKWITDKVYELCTDQPDEKSYHNSYTITHNGEQYNVVEKIEPFGDGFRSSVTINGELWGESDTNDTLEEAKWLFNQDYFAETE